MITVFIHQAITFFTNPLTVALALLVGGAVCYKKGRVRLGRFSLLVGIVGLYVFSAGWTYGLLGGYLERMYPPQTVESLPDADAIVVLGGGVSGNTNTLCYVELYMSADRPVHAARIFKAGKAPRVYTTFDDDAKLMVECGVPREAIVFDDRSKNTEQEAKTIAEKLKGTSVCSSTSNFGSRPKLLLVTSAWHMRRAKLLFERYAPGVEIVPAACDYEALLYSDETFKLKTLLPSPDSLLKNSYMVKEYIGYWAYLLKGK